MMSLLASLLKLEPQLPSLSGKESAKIVLLLMAVENPSKK
jgi:hypothetical protein